MRTKLLNAVERRIEALNSTGQPRSLVQALRDFQEALVLKESPYWIIMKHLNFMRIDYENFGKELDLAKIQENIESMDEDHMRSFVEEVYGFKYIVTEGEEDSDEISSEWKRAVSP